MTVPPPMIRTDTSNAFAHNTIKVRVPTTIRDVQQLNPDYPESIQRALTELAHTIANDQRIAMLDPLAPDYEVWAPAFAQHVGDSWLKTEWFYAETFFYSHLMQVVRWWETGRDPFAPKKTDELMGSGLWELVDQALSVRAKSPEERLMALVHSMLWGNRIDLSFAASLAHGSTGHSDDLLVDDSVQVVDHLLKSTGALHIISDNTGSELAMDLAVADAWLDHAENRVIFHLKMHPTFVSDATVPDMLALIKEMTSSRHSEGTRQFGEWLRANADAGRLRFIPDFYWNSSYLLWDMPSRLADVFRRAALVIIKGDANYRRMVGDALWPPETPFAAVTEYFPAALLALRTMKSDPVVGLPAELPEQLNGVDAEWRVNGRRGVIQFRP